MHRAIPPALILFTAISLPAQWLNHASPSTPRTRDGKPNLTAPAPHTRDGHPDLSGVWRVEPTPRAELTKTYGDQSAVSVPGDDFYSLSKYTLNVLSDFKPGEEPIRPEAAQHRAGPTDNPTTRCLPGGIPFTELLPEPFKLIQTPTELVMLLTETDGTIRQIYTDGRKVPDDPQPLWLGYSVGHWDGDTLVVDTTGFNDKSWLDGFGHMHSEALHITERYHRRDFGHMDVAVTIDDPKTFTRPFTIKFTDDLLPDTDVIEYYCAENERDRPHLPSR